MSADKNNTIISFFNINSRTECSAYCQEDKSNCNIFMIENSTGICRLGNLDQRLNSIGTQPTDMHGYVDFSNGSFINLGLTVFLSFIN